MSSDKIYHYITKKDRQRMENASLLCLTLQYNFNDVEAVEGYLANPSTRETVEKCLPIALRNVMNEALTACKTCTISPMPIPNAATTLSYLLVLFEPYSLQHLNKQLIRAAAGGLTYAVPYLIGQGANADYNNQAALQEAVRRGYVEIVKMLLDPSIIGHFPGPGTLIDALLKDAAEYGYTEIVKLLLDHHIPSPEGDRNAGGSTTGANIHMEYGSALDVAAANGHTDTLKFLLDYDPTTVKYINGALTKAAYNGRYDTVKMLLDYKKGGTIPASILNEKTYELANAAEAGYTDVVKLLLDNRADIHRDDEQALSRAAKHGHTDTVRFLLDQRANVHARNDTPLSLAAEDGHTDTIKLLVSRGANIHADNDYALRYASRFGYMDTVKYLLDQNANIDAANNEALKLSVKYDHDDVFQLLLSYIKQQARSE